MHLSPVVRRRFLAHGFSFRLHCAGARCSATSSRVRVPPQFCLRVASAAAVLAPRDPRETPVRAINSMIMPIPPVNWLRNRESNTGEKNASILNCVDRKMHRAPDIGAVPFLFAGFRCGIPGALKLCKLFGVKKSWDIKRDSAPVK